MCPQGKGGVDVDKAILLVLTTPGTATGNNALGGSSPSCVTEVLNFRKRRQLEMYQALKAEA